MYDSIFLTFWKSQHHWNKNRSVVARDQRPGEELTTKGHEGIWGRGVMQLFYLMIVVAVTQPNAFVKTHIAAL